MQESTSMKTAQSANLNENKWGEIIPHLENELRRQMTDANDQMVYMALAKNLRYLESNADNLLAYLPDYGLEVEERKQLIDTALRQRKCKYTPNIVVRAKAKVKEEKQLQAMDSLDLDVDYLKENLPPLPGLFKKLIGKYEKRFHAPLIIALLPIMGLYLSKVRFRFGRENNGDTHSFTFFSLFVGESGSDKSFWRKITEFLLEPIRQKDRQIREKKDKYNARVKRWTSTKSNKPKAPEAQPRIIGVDVTNAQLCNSMKYNQDTKCFIYSEEISKEQDAEKKHGNRKGLFCDGFDNVEYTVDRVGENSVSFSGNVNINLLFAGATADAREYLGYKQVAGGLACRFATILMPKKVSLKIPEYPNFSNEERDEIYAQLYNMEEESGMYYCPAVFRAIDEWQRQKGLMIMGKNEHLDTFRLRAAVMGYRAGMMYAVLEGCAKTSAKARITNSKTEKNAAEFAQWIAEFVFQNAALFFSNVAKEVADKNYAASVHIVSPTLIYNNLPVTFTREDVEETRIQMGKTDGSVDLDFTRWLNPKSKKSKCQVRDNGDGTYTKL